MKKVNMDSFEFDRKEAYHKATRNGRMTEELFTIYNMKDGETISFVYDDYESFKKAKARISAIKQRFPEMFRYFTEKESLAIYVKKYEGGN